MWITSISTVVQGLGLRLTVSAAIQVMTLRALLLITVLVVLAFIPSQDILAQDINKLKSGVVRVQNNSFPDIIGAGFIIKVDGNQVYIITAAHVVIGKQEPSVYLFSQQHHALRAKILDREYDDIKGLALLRLEVPTHTADQVTALKLNSTTKLDGGEDVKIIGFPDGVAFWTVSNGSIARVEGHNLVFSGAVRGGNSGAPVIFNGVVVGMVTDVTQADAYAARAAVIEPYIDGFVPDMIKSADDSSIYITKITNPPGGEKVQKTTVWLAASGKQTYTVSSITIEHQPGICQSGGSGAVLPDANYSFHFAYGSSMSDTLIPGLRLDPADRKEVWFTLGLAPRGLFETGCGNVTVALHYHTPDGLEGTLRLKEPPKNVKRLAKLLDVDVEYDDLVVTPRGMQRGKDNDESEATRLVYEPLHLPEPFSIPGEGVPESAPNIELTGDRMALNRAIVKKGVVPDIVKLLKSGDHMAFDLCAGLQEPECPEALVKTSNKFIDHALRALTIRHLIRPTNELADSILSSDISKHEAAYYFPTFRDAGSALTYYPSGKWAQALLLLEDRTPSYLSRQYLEGVYLRRDELTESERKLVEDFCWKQFDALYPKKSAMLYLLWRGHQKSVIDAKLSSLPESLIKDDEASNYREHRERLRKDLFGAAREAVKELR